MSKAVFI